MTISEYLKRRGIRAARFAILLQTSKGCVSRWANGNGVPSAAMLERIYRVTGGMVTPNDFFDFTREDVVLPTKQAGAAE